MSMMTSFLYFFFLTFNTLGINHRKRTQAIRRQQLTNYLNVFDHFVGLAFNWFNAAF